MSTDMPELKCDVCGEPAVGVASSCMPISFAYCGNCLREGAEPIFVFGYYYDEVSHDGANLADWFVENVKSYLDGKYISWNDYVKWRHTNGQGKSQPTNYDDIPPSVEGEDYDNDIGWIVPEEEASNFGCD